LRKFSANLVRIALSPEQISLVRMISMESGRYPELARRFYEKGPKRGEESLAAYFAKHIESGELRKADALMMSRNFLSLVTGSSVRWFVLGFESEPLTERAIKEHIAGVVDLFLRAYGTAKRA
jgi:TetR/AcrR family transcriptional regulator, mexJK operon transcriptional repressor